MTTVQDPEQFLADFIACAKKAKKRIYLQSMLFEIGEFLTRLEPVLTQKAREGVDVQITTDWVSKRYAKDDANLFPSLDPEIRKQTTQIHEQTNELIQRWQEAGVQFTFTNRPGLASKILAIYRRNHIKLYIVDDFIWIGGVNMFDEALEFIDIMVKFSDPNLVAAGVQQFFSVNENRPLANASVRIPPYHELLIDAGLINDSLIYDKAVQAIARADHSLIFVSQFVPDGKLLQAIIKAARRGVKVVIITSNKDHKMMSTFPYNLPYKLLLAKIRQQNNISLFHQRTKVHAKIILVDDQIALFGSHNFVQVGVLLGTEEVAIRTKDPVLVAAIKHFVDKQTTRNLEISSDQKNDDEERSKGSDQ